jgi:hypothetical protein
LQAFDIPGQSFNEFIYAILTASIISGKSFDLLQHARHRPYSKAKEKAFSIPKDLHPSLQRYSSFAPKAFILRFKGIHPSLQRYRYGIGTV